MNGQPLPALGFEGFASVGTDEIVFPLAGPVSASLFHSDSIRPSRLQPVQDGIKHPVAPLSLGRPLNSRTFLDDLVAVAFAAREEMDSSSSGFEDAATRSFG